MPAGRYDPELPPPQLVAEIRRRLEHVCADWPAELFEAMTLKAAWIEFKYERAMVDGLRGKMVHRERKAG